MYVCNYCKRNFKEKFETCRACGSTSFSNKAYFGEVIIKTPPEGGYRININNYQKAISNANIFLIIGIVVLVASLLFELPFILIGFSMPVLMLAFLIPILIGPIIMIASIKSKNKNKKAMNKALKLSKTGILVKNMPYEAINTGTMVAGKYYKCIKVNYKNSAGVSIPLYSETKFDMDNIMMKDHTVDLLIDPDDYSNYFIDFEIY